METQFTPNVKLGYGTGNYYAGVNIDTPEEINPIGNWTDYPVEHERQNELFETSACTCFSNNNAKEPLSMFAAHAGNIPSDYNKWLKDNNYYKNGFINFDDRVPAMHAEIEVGVGTYLWKAAEACRKWSLPQGILPPAKTIAEYYDKSKITKEAIELQKEFDKRFKWVWFWVSSVDEGLKYSPVVGTVAFMNGNSILCPTTPHNHAVTAIKKDSESVTIQDSYNQQFKKYCPQGFSDYLCWKLIIIKDSMIDKTKFLKEHDRHIVRNSINGAYGIVTGGQLFRLTEERAGLCLVDMYKRGELKSNPKEVTISDEDWNVIWSGRDF